MLIVDSSKQSSVHPRVRKLLSEVLATIIQGEPGLLLESQFAGQPFDFVLLQKADSKSLARLLILRQAQLLDQREALSSDVFEASNQQLPDSRTRALEKLTKQPVRGEGRAIWIRDERTVAQLNHRVDLEVRVLFHKKLIIEETKTGTLQQGTEARGAQEAGVGRQCTASAGPERAERQPSVHQRLSAAVVDRCRAPVHAH